MRISSRKEDVRKERYGLTIGRKGVDAATGGVNGIHNERCTDRIEKEISLKEPTEKMVTKVSIDEIQKSEEEQEIGDSPPGIIEDFPRYNGIRTQEKVHIQKGVSSGRACPTESKQKDVDEEMNDEVESIQIGTSQSKRER